jgi:hypothetical protein
VLTDVARRLAEPAEKLLTQSFRFAGWVVGRTAAPVFGFVAATGRPVVRTVTAISRPAVEKLWAQLPKPEPKAKVAAPPPAPVRPPHVAVVPVASDAPTPATAHAQADALLARSEPASTTATADELPVSGWDGLTIAAIRQRTRNLGDADILTLLAYERAHAARPAVILNLENRLAKARNRNGARPS